MWIGIWMKLNKLSINMVICTALTIGTQRTHPNRPQYSSTLNHSTHSILSISIFSFSFSFYYIPSVRSTSRSVDITPVFTATVSVTVTANVVWLQSGNVLVITWWWSGIDVSVPSRGAVAAGVDVSYYVQDGYCNDVKQYETWPVWHGLSNKTSKDVKQNSTQIQS